MTKLSKIFPRIPNIPLACPIPCRIALSARIPFVLISALVLLLFVESFNVEAMQVGYTELQKLRTIPVYIKTTDMTNIFLVNARSQVDPIG